LIYSHRWAHNKGECVIVDILTLDGSLSCHSVGKHVPNLLLFIYFNVLKMGVNIVLIEKNTAHTKTQKIKLAALKHIAKSFVFY